MSTRNREMDNLAPTSTVSVNPSLLSMQQAIAALRPSFSGSQNADGSNPFAALSPHIQFPSVVIGGAMSENEAKLIEYREQKVAGFEIDGKQMLCLPQVYELFLKSLVGGLHTVYTKLKRLDIHPLVCNVEQVRALRQMTAIQPGVNRCKLISCTDFDSLLNDCNNTSSRPGRPPKRSPPQSSVDAATWQTLFKKPKFNGEEGEIDRAVLSKTSSTARDFTGHQQQSDISDTQSPTNSPSFLQARMQQQLLSSLLPFSAQQMFVQQMMAVIHQQQNKHNGLSSNMTVSGGLAPPSMEYGNRFQSDHTSRGDGDNDSNVTGSISSVNNSPTVTGADSAATGPLDLCKASLSKSTGQQKSIISCDKNEVQSEATEEVSSEQPRSSLEQIPTISVTHTNPLNDKTDHCNCNLMSIQRLLLDVANMVATARSRQENAAKQFSEVWTIQMENLTAERNRIVSELKKERQMKQMFFKRWCRAKKEKFEIQSKWLSLIEKNIIKEKSILTQNSGSTETLIDCSKQ